VVQITVSDDIARQISGAPMPIVLVDSHGRELGQVTRQSVLPTRANIECHSADDDWAEAKRQMDAYRRQGGTFYTTQEVLMHLESLEKE
jgi:hypothetical protein